MTRVVFPCDQETWWIVKDQLHYLKNLSEQPNCELTKLAECHQRIYNTNLGLMEQPDVQWGSSIYYGLVKYMRKHASGEERDHFLQETFPSIIELALRIETVLPTEGIIISEQQKEGSYSIPRQLCVTILALAFLCLFPNEQRGRGTKLNNINFNKFFSNLPIPSQNAKLQCILNFFDRVSSEWDRLTGSIVFSRQVLNLEEIPSLDTWLDCTLDLCPLTVYTEGTIEEAGSGTIEVDFANRYIGGGTLARGRVQEEIRFTVCPELIVSMLFMEVMDDNEAIVIKGYEQFSATVGYASALQFAGDFRDDMKVDSDGNLKKMLCAIDAVSYSHGRGREQYTDHFILRDLNKAFTGFCVKFPVVCPQSVSEEEYYTADESSSSTASSDVPFTVMVYADNLVSNAVEMALFEAVLKLTKRRKFDHSSSSDTQDSSLSKSSASVGSVSASLGSAMSADNEMPMDHLEVNFRDWLAHYRRRSSNLSDLSSRRSSYDLPSSRRSSGCSTKYSSEFSSEFEEYYDNFQQQEKYKYHTIKEEVGPSAINEFALNLAQSLLREGVETYSSTRTVSGVQKFHNLQPSAVLTKPSPVKPRSKETKTDDSDDDHHRNSSDIEREEISIDENVVRSFIDNLFSQIWPFQISETRTWTNTQRELRAVLVHLSRYKFNNHLEDIYVTVELDDSESIDSDSDTTSVDNEPEVNTDDDNVLINIANNLVVKAFSEALIEYKQRYTYNSCRNYSHSRHSSSSSLGDIDFGAVGNSDFNINVSAADVADEVMLEIYDSIPDPGARPKAPQIISSTVPIQAHCDINIQTSDNLRDTEVLDNSDMTEVVYKSGEGEAVPKADNIEIIPVEISYEAVNMFPLGTSTRFIDTVDNTDSITEGIVGGVIDSESHISSPLISVPHSQLICDIESDEHNKENSSPRRHSLKSNLSKSPINSNSLSERSTNVCQSPKRDSINISPVHIISSNSSPRSAKSVSRKLKTLGSKSNSSSQGKNRRGSRTSDQDHKRFSSPVDSHRSKKDYDQFANCLSRDLLTNVFLKVQDTGDEDMYSFPRRSSEPMQISNGAALQRLEHSAPTVNGRRTQWSKTDEDIGKFAEELSRHGASCEVGHRKSGSGFRDPILSRFAEELMKANVSVPTFQVFNGCVSTSESSRSVCSTVSSFRDPVLASFEDELLNSSYGKSSARTQSSWSNRKGQVCHPRRESGNDSSDNNISSIKFPSRYVGASFDSEFSAVSWLSVRSDSLKANTEVSDYADRLSRRILCEAVTVAFREDFPVNLNISDNARSRRPRASRCTNLNDYSTKLATSILKTAMSEAENRMVCSDWLEQNKMVTWGEETECLEYSNDESETSDSDYLDSEGQGSLNDRGTDGTMSSLEYEDALDLPYQRLEAFAESIATSVMETSVSVLKREQESQLRRQYGRPIATGNWGCGAFGGNPHLKSLIQWMAASYAGTPHLIYYTFGHEKMEKFQDVVDTVLTRGWTISELMLAVRQYCMTTHTQLQQTGEMSHDLFDIILHGEFHEYPGVS